MPTEYTCNPQVGTTTICIASNFIDVPYRGVPYMDWLVASSIIIGIMVIALFKYIFSPVRIIVADNKR